jgi:hypothetical protein
MIDWAGLLKQEDVEGLWNGIYQLVSRHPAVRPLHFATDGAAVTSQTEINADLAQELFLELFQKQRFEHYAANRYSSSEIENEMAHIELPNLVGARLRKRYPESFRMARRVSSLLKTSPRFTRIGGSLDAPAEPANPPRKRGRPPKKTKLAEVKPSPADLEDEGFDALDDLHDDEAVSRPRRGRMVNQVFGLREWSRSKPLKDAGHFSDAIKSVAMRRRDTRIVGRSGASQLILSNPDLEALMVEIFKAIDSPTDVRTIRQLVLARIPLQDYNIASLDEELSVGNGGGAIHREAADTRETPEGALLRGEQDRRIAGMAEEFLTSLRHAVNNNERRYTRLLTTLWYCYYDPQGPSQLEIAKLLGVSDSLVSDNRRLIEHELKKLKLTMEDGAIFSESLQRLIAQDHAAMAS